MAIVVAFLPFLKCGIFGHLLSEIKCQAGHFGGQSASAAAATLAANGTATLQDQDGNGGKSGEGICPCDSKHGVKDESGQSEKGEIGAGGGLDRVCGERVIAGSASELTLLPREQRHDDQGSNGDANSEKARLGLNLTGQGQHGSDSDDGGEDKEQGSGSDIDPLVVEAESGSQSEDDKRGGEQLHKTVKTEGQKRGAMRPRSREQGDGALDEHPGEGDGLQKNEPAPRWRKRGRVIRKSAHGLSAE